MRNIKAIAAVLCLGLFGACATDVADADADEDFAVQAAERKVKIDPPTNMPTWLPMQTMCDMMETVFVFTDLDGTCTTTTISNCTWSEAQHKCNCKYETKRC